MKRALIFTVSIIFSVVFAQNTSAQSRSTVSERTFPAVQASIDEEPPNRKIFFEGSAVVSAHRTFFMENFRMEAGALGFEVAANRTDAVYIFKFDVQRYSDIYDPSIQYIILVSLIINRSSQELVSFGWPFSDTDEMYEYNQFVFYKAAVLIPEIDDGEEIIAEDDRWRNMWVYPRVSIDFPITFYLLQSRGLVDNIAIYRGDFDDPSWSMSIDNRIVAQPAVTIGVEVQFLDWMSAEPKVMFGWEHLNNNNFFTLTAGLELKFPLKIIKHIMLEPYAAFSYPVYIIEPEKIFDSFPKFGIGGGFQLGIKGGKTGAFFIDINYMQFIGEAGIYNIYKFGDTETSPKVIYFQRAVIGLGIGYKYGLKDRK